MSGDPEPDNKLDSVKRRLAGMAVAASETERKAVEEERSQPETLKKVGNRAMIVVALLVVGFSVATIVGTIGGYRALQTLPDAPPIDPAATAARSRRVYQELQAALEQARLEAEKTSGTATTADPPPQAAATAE